MIEDFFILFSFILSAIVTGTMLIDMTWFFFTGYTKIQNYSNLQVLGGIVTALSWFCIGAYLITDPFPNE